MRFAFLPLVTEPNATADFLTNFKSALEAQILTIERLLSSQEAETLQPHGRFAVENGLRVFSTHLNWIDDTMKAFKL